MGTRGVRKTHRLSVAAVELITEELVAVDA